MTFLTITTVALAAAMAVNHLVHGFSCWGLQSGGPTSALIYDLQILTALLSLVGLTVLLVRRRLPLQPARLFSVGLGVVASVALYALFGWAAHTSLHHQGIENLFAYLAVAATSLMASTYSWGGDTENAKADPSTGDEQNATMQNRSRQLSDNSYQSPEV